MIQDCFVMVVLESLVYQKQKLLNILQKKNMQVQFSSIFCIFEPFTAVTV